MQATRAGEIQRTRFLMHIDRAQVGRAIDRDALRTVELILSKLNGRYT
jgi:hypothetical protein